MTKRNATFFAILAAALYAISTPLSKLFLGHISPTVMAGFLYLGAGIGMLILDGVERAAGIGGKKEQLTRKELPFTVAMVVLDIAAPILLMYGISRTNSANVSLLNNFEIVATSVVALVIFREVISKRLWLAIGIVTAASMILSFEGSEGFAFDSGSLFALGACICWGFENNCTRMISNKSAEEIVIIKGIGSGAGSLIIAAFLREPFPQIIFIPAVLLLGFVAYGLSIRFYILAQKELGAAKTSAYYSIAPFLGVLFSLFLLGERPGVQFYLAFCLMIAATVLIIKDTIALQHTHAHTHTHTHLHRHGNIVHSHEHTHTHTHLHTHGEHTEEHNHVHGDNIGEHDHVHGVI